MTRYCRYCQVKIATHLLKVFAMPAGQTLHTVIVFVQTGDRITFTGFYRAVSLRVNPTVSYVISVYRTHIDASENAYHTDKKFWPLSWTALLFTFWFEPTGPVSSL